MSNWFLESFVIICLSSKGEIQIIPKTKFIQMKNALKFSMLFLVMLLSTSLQAQDQNSPRWSVDPRTSARLYPVGEYAELPGDDSYVPSTNGPQTTITPLGTFAVSSNFRVHPRTAGTQSETPITVHPFNPLIMFASANTYPSGTFSTGCYVTTNGGLTWFGNDTLGGTIKNSGDPAPAIDRNGRFIMSFITSTSMGASYSTNNGVNWTTPVNFPGATSGADKNFTATDDVPTSSYYGRTYTVYTEFSGTYLNRIVATYTTNSGVSWTSIAPVSPPPSSGHHHQGCDIKVGPDGEVYVVWANCTSNGQNSTEDSLGFAVSYDGGASWSNETNRKVNMNGIRTSSLINGIRMNGFPRIDVDRTCGPRRGWIYVVTAEKSLSPAVGVADIVLLRSTNDGSSFARIKVNQNTDQNEYDYCPAVRVDDLGNVNVCYYSTRNSAANDSAEIYLSTSTDGGITFSDVKISDHKFKPKPISGLAGGYQGDYIGITSGTNGKIWPYWAEDGGGVNRYQAWTASVDFTPETVCEEFTCVNFPPAPMYLELDPGTNYWSRQTNSAYSGNGSARFNSFSAPNGTEQSISASFATFSPPLLYARYLTFDEAYAPYNNPAFGPDSLYVESSTNGGVTYTLRAALYGSYSGGTLNTSPPTSSSYSPSSREWRPKIYSLPSGTNKIRLRAVSGFGNNIFVDNICVKTLPSLASGVDVLCALQGFYRSSTNTNIIKDTLQALLCRFDLPGVSVDSAKAVLDSATLTARFVFTRALSGEYYLVLRHRNSIETWSGTTAFDYTRVLFGSDQSYTFLYPSSQAYGSNMRFIDLSPFRYGLYSGDVNQDNGVDGSDLSLIDNSAYIFASGYVAGDLNGDYFVDATDFALADNNASNFVVREAPPGAPSSPHEYGNNEDVVPLFTTDIERQKYAESLAKGIPEDLKPKQIKKLSYEEFLEMKKSTNQNNSGSNR